MIENAYQKLKEGHFERAIEAFSECVAQNSLQANAYEGRAQAYFQLKNWSLSLSDFSKAKELNPDNLENWIGVAMSLAMHNKIYEAIGVFDALLSNHPKYVRGYIQLGQLYYRLGIIAKGHQQMEKALISDPSLSERRTIEKIQKEQKELDKRRFYRPDFEALRQKNLSSKNNWFKTILNLFKKSEKQELEE
ncbi:MAG: tetratricopeptide repeat protein [Chlamydiae bacterium]|nr:tetratricopeptide repeat protein [Chlamydiota bacterium]MBI3277571.1 tetratricopeptide repeat protein [Chlamydiota bacterium]